VTGWSAGAAGWRSALAPEAIERIESRERARRKSLFMMHLAKRS
jgi:hypothetical protein